MVSIVNLLPLMISDNEKMLRVILPVLWIAIWESHAYIDNNVDMVVILVCGFVVVFQEAIYPVFLSSKLEFLPLMVNSVLCSGFNLLFISRVYYLELNRIELEEAGYERVADGE